MPLWFANGTDATTGNRVITAPIAAPDQRGSEIAWPYRCIDLNSNKQYRSIRIFGTFGEMMPLQETAQVGSLIDGGYIENEGLQTTLELAEWLGRQSPGGRSVRPIIVQATGDGEANV